VLIAFVMLTTALPVTVTMSVLNAVCASSNALVAVMRMRAISVASCVPGTLPTTTKRNCAPAIIGPVVLIDVKLSGTPLPSASA
jgi:hypothetical protein